ncbi:hypothetical protein AVEN_218523-1 [Araneus ventricosus]|uniref:Prokineticin domain-containing protein n=1 Tax=Araneus ventricosus TaxID=182803 RepID=A0A4Y2JJ17_ARAVE|nr:hypothetical protein AVEN_218523-1 [Araneus ventricosus]
MKAIFLAVEVTAFLLPGAKRCDTAKDCEPDECCILSIPFIYKKGKCKKLALEGKHCSTEISINHGKFFLHCPCVSGFFCEAKRVFDTKHGKIPFNQRCVSPGSTTVQPE